TAETGREPRMFAYRLRMTTIWGHGRSSGRASPLRGNSAPEADFCGGGQIFAGLNGKGRLARGKSRYKGGRGTGGGKGEGGDRIQRGQLSGARSTAQGPAKAEANLNEPWTCKKCGKSGTGVPATQCPGTAVGTHVLR